jgi:hypothetical protein
MLLGAAMRRRLLVSFLALGLVAAAGLLAPPSARAVTSGVTGPVSGGTFNTPQGNWVGATAAGYVEQEWFVDGVASGYAPVGTWTPDGIWPAVESGSAEFRTRIVVRRPADAARFNGTVIVEWNNVTAGFDSGPVWLASIDEIVRGGYVYIGVSAQRVGVNAMIGGDPGRYATLNHPGDAYSYDMFTQVARAVRGAARRVILPGLTIERVLAAGESQSASRLVTYINAVHPIERAFNGFLIYSRGSGAAAIADGVTMPTRPIVRTDTPGRIMMVQTEGDVAVLRSHLARQDDGGRFRLWEVAGGAHADEHTLSQKNPPQPTVAGNPCEYRMNSARTHMVVNAAIRALDRWVAKEGAPRRAPRLALTPDAETAEDPLVRDEDGLAVGGIRLPQMEVPTATINGLVNPPAPGAPPLFAGLCRLFGRTIEFSQAEIDARYPSHVEYSLLVHWFAVTNANLGFLTREDAAILVWEALTSDIGADV